MRITLPREILDINSPPAIQLTQVCAISCDIVKICSLIESPQFAHNVIIMKNDVIMDLVVFICPRPLNGSRRSCRKYGTIQRDQMHSKLAVVP